MLSGLDPPAAEITFFFASSMLRSPDARLRNDPHDVPARPAAVGECKQDDGCFGTGAHKICKRIAFRDGRIVACSSDDPPSRLGQFLLSRGKITKDQLRDALARQKSAARTWA